MSKHSQSHHKKHKSKNSPERRSNHIKKHRRQNIRSHVIQLNNYFEENKYLKHNQEADQNLIQMIVDLYSETEGMDLDTDIREIIEPNLQTTYQSGFDQIMFINEFLKLARERTKLKQLPVKIAEIVAKFIELMDIAKLPSIATIDFVNTLLDELKVRLENLEQINLEPIIMEIRQWENKILAPSVMDRILFRSREKLSEKECRRLERDVSKWYEQFKLELADL